MTDLNDLVEALKREVATPGEFATTFPNTDDEDLANLLCDAFAEAQLDGFFPDQVLDVASQTVSPDLSAAGGALILLYAGMRMVRNQIRSTRSSLRVKAGPVEYETQAGAASVLRQDLLDLTARRNALLANASARTDVIMLDNYTARMSAQWSSVGGFYAYELA